jgi:hypothetical protein
MAWKYSQSTGQLFKPDGISAGFGFAGQPPGINDPAYQFVHGKGPLPVGLYDMVQWIEKDDHLGMCVIVLKERPETVLTNRDPGSFRIHGPKNLTTRGLTAFLQSSEGCVVFGDCVSRRAIWESKDRELLVVP